MARYFVESRAHKQVQHRRYKPLTMKNFAAILSILSIVVTPCLAQFDNATCVSETASLSDNLAVEAAYDAMGSALKADLKSDATQFCSVISLTCTIDIGEYSSSLKTTCEAQGGQLVERDLSKTCSGTVTGRDLKIVAEAAPLCAGASCDPTALPAGVEAGLEAVIGVIVDGVSLVFPGNLTCDVQIAPTSAGSGSGGGDGTPTTTEPAPAPTSAGSGSGGGDGTPTATEPAPAPTSRAQATTIWVSAASLTLVSFIWM
jgi:hypothetical protein